VKKSVVCILLLVFLFSTASCAKPDGTDNPSAGDIQNSESAPQVSSTDENPPTSAADTSAPQYGGTLRVVMASEGASPIGVPWETYGIEIYLTIPFIETLFIETPTGEILPALAESYKLDEENLELRVKVREGIKFHDGSDFNAEVAVWNLQQSFDHGGNLNTAITSIEQRGDYEFALVFDSWQNNLVSGIAQRPNAMISKEAFEKNGIEWARDNPVGTGPFVFQEYVKSGYIKTVRNENYWKEGLPYLDGMDIEFIRDTMTQNIALQATGEQRIDSLGSTNAEQISMFRDMGYNVISQSIGTLVLVPSSANEDSPLADRDVRLALSFALDRDAICAGRGFGILNPAYQTVGDGYKARLPDSDGLPGFDPDRAKELLAQAGYPDGFKTTLIAQPGMADRDVVVAIQGQLAAIGIQAEVEFPDSGGYTSMRSGGWEGILVQSHRSLPVIEGTFTLIYSTNTNLYSSMWKPDELEEQIQTAAGTFDDGSAIRTVHKTILDNILVVPIFYLYESTINRPYIEKADWQDYGPQVQPEYTWFSGN
jgi:peptide/nickel transport system substrate-binding protein